MWRPGMVARASGNEVTGNGIANRNPVCNRKTERGNENIWRLTSSARRLPHQESSPSQVFRYRLGFGFFSRVVHMVILTTIFAISQTLCTTSSPSVFKNSPLLCLWAGLCSVPGVRQVKASEGESHRVEITMLLFYRYLFSFLFYFFLMLFIIKHIALSWRVQGLYWCCSLLPAATQIHCRKAL